MEYKEKKEPSLHSTWGIHDVGPPNANEHAKHISRKLNRRQVQMYSIGGVSICFTFRACLTIWKVIGTAVFITLGKQNTEAGPLFLLLGYSFWSCIIYLVNECVAVPTSRLPVENAFVDFAVRYVSPGVGMSIGYNYFLGMVCSSSWVSNSTNFHKIGLLCFEITNFGNVIDFWTSEPLHPAILTSVCIVTYALIHCWDSRWFGESEFWIVLVKILLLILCLFYTLCTMCGANPLHDTYGFRYWRDPGPVVGTTRSEQLRAFLSALLGASFAVAGPDMLSIISGEARDPRRVMPIAFRTVFVRLFVFFVLSTLAVGIVISSEDQILLDAINNDSAGAAQSPYVASMIRLKVSVFPHLVYLAIATSIYSAGSAFFFNSARTLHGLAMKGMGPPVFKRVNRNGVPYVTVVVTIAFACLSYLQVGNGSAKVLDWFIGRLRGISTAAQLITWCVMCVTYIRWQKAMEVQGLWYTEELPYTSKFLPWGAWLALFCATIVTLINGYTVFLDGGWDIADFIFAYFSPICFVVLALVYSIIKREGLVSPENADLHSGMREIEEHENTLLQSDIVHTNVMKRTFNWIL
ncbi:hypothetical protein E3Q17_01220 [Wallemia mellicola]|uniref:Amino acid permease/ SLC12A domain-containing protein n=1 Tax=Wallemia mellicola TaxID=1708541 RepID=A0A4T0P9M9_9BASI|nr:hypothetical protein E3Q17_01220 [Wallemia mellicola]TIC06149.1 hypothetical protein E3Q16_01420 [Wallemia mellicola]TIC13484.1 hypothetical protein E3Q14_01252 [Wallemia mellicola]TIC24334.1 hypothetical protein E3Q12_01455 [Wallemia mellicola]TIC36115.1 hypothetical protein E3Q09_01698 [Wallemia mellicola]